MRSELRQHLANLDPTLARRAETFWVEVSKELHERQTRVGESVGGSGHIGHVERNIWRLIHEAPGGRESQFSRLDWFILSCAACSHDFDKGLSDKWRQQFGHGGGSGRFVVDNCERLGLLRAEAIAIDYVDSVHDLRGEEFAKQLGKLPSSHSMADGSVDLQRLAVIVKAADTLHTDGSRVSKLAQEPDSLGVKDRSKFDARSAFTGWSISGKEIVLEAYPTKEQVGPVRIAFGMIKEKDWQPIARDMQHYLGVSQLELKVHDRYLIAASPSPVASRPPEMDYYSTADAAYFAGRDKEISDLLTLVLASSASRLIGPSGVGKSSLLHAGLIPASQTVEGWLFLITRPDRLANRFYTAADLGGSVDKAADFSEVCRAARAGHEKLAIVFDQFEDIAYFGTFDADHIAETLHQAQRELGEGVLHYAFAYRDDVESLLGPLWASLTHSSRPLPTQYLQRLSKDQARDALDKVLAHSGLTVANKAGSIEWLLSELIAATQRESAATRDAVYPPFLQMVVRRMADYADAGMVDLARFREQAQKDQSAVDVAISEYLQRGIEQLDQCSARPGQQPGTNSAARGRAVLLALARSGGTKGAATEDRLGSEARIAPGELACLLAEMALRRLIRRLPDGQWEIIHDLLARQIMETCESDSERRFKHAREALQSAAQTFRIHHTVLNEHQMRDLWVARDRLPGSTLTKDERMVLLVSTQGGQEHGDLRDQWMDGVISLLPGWVWLCDLDACAFDEVLVAAYESGVPAGMQAAVNYAGAVARRENLPWVRKALEKEAWGIRHAALELIGKVAAHEDVLWLRDMLKHDDSYIRRRSLEIIGRVATREDLPWLRDVLLEHEDFEMREAAATAIANFAIRDDLPWLRNALGGDNPDVRPGVLEAIGSVAIRDDLPWLREAAHDSREGVRRAAVKAIGKVATREDLAWLREMLEHERNYTRVNVLEVIGNIVTREDLPWLFKLVEDKEFLDRYRVVEAIGNVATREDLPRLQELLKDEQDSRVLWKAVDAIGKVATNEELSWLSELLYDENFYVRQSTLRVFDQSFRGSSLELLAALSEAILDNYPEVSSQAAVLAGKRCTRDELLSFLSSHQEEMATATLAVFDIFLYGPQGLRTELEKVAIG